MAFPYTDEQTIYAAARDVTDHKNATEQLARYAHDLDLAREAEAENADRLSRLVREPRYGQGASRGGGTGEG